MTERIREIYQPDVELATAVRAIAQTPLKAEPDTELIYGGTGFHVAGRVAEVASGENWHTLFRKRIAEPLGLKNKVYGRRDRKRIIPEPARNPWLGGGLLTSVEGYLRFVRMLLNQGMFQGRRVLSAESLREMRIDQSRSATVCVPTGWDLRAEYENFIAAFPDAYATTASRGGRKRERSMWNDGSGRRDDDVDNVAFLAALIDEIAGRYSIDRERVYITGFGAGASMAFRAGHELAGLIAAIVPLSGHLWDAGPQLAHPVSVISILGAEDHVNPIKEGLVRKTTVTGVVKPQIRSSLQHWARALGLASDTGLRYFGEDVFRERWGPGADGAEVVFYLWEGLGHAWPGSDAQCRRRQDVPTSDALSGTDVIWEFLSRQH